MLNIHVRETDQAVVVTLEGRIDSEGACLLEKAFPEGCYDHLALILDLSATSFLSSLGVRTLIRLKKAHSRHEHLFLLAGVQPLVLDVLRMTGLLGVFTLEADVKTAGLRVARAAARGCALGREPGEESSFRWSGLDPHPGFLEVWGSLPPRTEDGKETDIPFTTVTLEELNIAWGVGGLGSRPEDASAAAGPFFSAGSWVVVQPVSPAAGADFLLAPQPENAYFHIRQAISYIGEPVGRLESLKGSARGEELLNQASRKVREQPGPDFPAPFGFLLAGRKEQQSLLVAGVGIPGPDHSSSTPEMSLIREIGQRFAIQSASDLFYGIGFHFSSSAPLLESAGTLRSRLAAMLTLETEPTLASWDPAWELSDPVVWIFPPSPLSRAEERRLQIQRTDRKAFPYEWECLVRSMYSDFRSILADPLPGGYSSTTFRVSGVDRLNRKTLPTVLKISTLDWIDREESAYRDCVRQFILNNSAVIMGKAQMAQWAALRYNFVGLDGPDTRLTWLGDHLLRRPFGEVEPIFHSLFGRILLPWYGQTRREATFLFRDHDPRGLFPRMEEDAAEVLGIHPDQADFDCPELEMRLPNPYRFLRVWWEDRRQDQRLLHRSITHGDLNLNNILIDDKENIYVIDFSETAIRNVASDFARMEALVLLQMTRLETSGDLVCIARCCRALTEVDSLEITPGDLQGSDDPMLEKALSLIALLRGYAARYAPGQEDLWAYWLPLLQWSAPIVSFRQFPAFRKRLAAIAAALICRRLSGNP